MNTRKTAILILKDIYNGAYSNIILQKKLDKFKDIRDKNLITELVYGVLRQQKRLDYILSQISNRDLTKIHLIVKIALRLGLYQLVFLDRIPARAVVNETVNALKGLSNKGAISFLNAVLRSYLRKRNKIKYPDSDRLPLKYLTYYYSHPEWILKIWLKEYGFDDTLRLCIYNNRVPELSLRYNTLKFTEREFLEFFNYNNIDIKKSFVPSSFVINSSSNIKNLPLYNEGGFFVQGQAATLSSLILNPEPGMRVLDMAAAPGGKTCHLAEIMENKGELIALDIYKHKIKLIKKNLYRFGINIVTPVISDGRKYYSSKLFDMILVDAPCSGLGLIASKPEIKWNKKKDDIKKLSRIQMELLENALLLLKPGGILLYTTCTLNREENQDLIRRFLILHQNDLDIYDIKSDLKRLKIDNVINVQKEGWLELFPPDSNTEGFFMAKLIKVKGNI
jgi:16S rRNA (cytosine967-C5)-methyltransferase